MAIKEMLTTAKRSLISNWFVCRITSGRQSARYGIRFSYPIYILLVSLGVLLVNPFILAITAIIAFFGVILPMHPFDYVYNFIAKIVGFTKIPARGSELQFNSVVALVFNLIVIGSMIFGMKLNYPVMALIYVLSSVFFITVQLFTDNFSIYSIPLLFKKDK